MAEGNMKAAFFAAIVNLMIATSSDFAQSGIKGIDLPADPIIPLPAYHYRERTDQLADELARFKPAAVCVAAHVGLPASVTVLIARGDAFFPEEANGALRRLVYYGMLSRGFLAAMQIRKGMIDEELDAILP